MTRINTIAPYLLTDQHLMAEYRELPMVNASLARTKRSQRGIRLDRIPKSYTLNAGHVTFHYDKGKYLRRRFDSLVVELNNRRYSIDPSSRTIDWDVFTPELDNDWKSAPEDDAINVERIVARIQMKPTWYRYNGTPIDGDFIRRTYSEFVDIPTKRS